MWHVAIKHSPYGYATMAHAMTQSPMTTVYLSLGSNIEDRMAHLAAAEEKLEGTPGIKIIKKSKIYETEPWPLHDAKDAPEHPHKEEGMKWFLNQVIKIETKLDPHMLLEVIETIESDLGRTEKYTGGPREIDIDILLFGDEVIESDELTIPHRHMNDRQFVLVPLVEIEPHLKDPVSRKNYEFILKNITDDHKVEPYF